MLSPVKRLEKGRREAEHTHIVTNRSLQKTLYPPYQLLRFVKSNLGHYCPGLLLFFPSESKKIRAVLMNWNTKSALYRTITVEKDLLSVSVYGG